MLIAEYFFLGLAVALAASFLLSLCEKWGWVEWLQVHAPNECLHELFSCKFCMSFWMCFLLSIVAAAVAGAWGLLLTPVVFTTIIRRLW